MMNPAEKKKLVVIGNGMAGARFVEEMVGLGGQDTYDIAVIGEESCGNYNRILLSGVLSGSHDADDIFINPLDWYAENDVTLHAGVRAIGIDRKGKMAYGSGGLLLPYDKLVIATGSSAFVPPMDGLYDDDGDFKKGAFVFRTLDDCAAIIDHAQGARRAAVIGGGLLGLEAARGLMNRGLEVDVVHLMGWLMETQLDSLSGQLLQQSLEELGVRFHLEKLTTAVLGDGQVTGLQFKDGDTLDCDLVVMSAGIRPNVDLARMAGLHVRRGILVNDGLTCRNDQDIYAIGECAEHRSQVYGLVAPLWEQARVLAERLTGRNAESAYAGSRISTKLKVMGVELAVAGSKDPLDDDDEVVTYVEPNRNVYKKVIVRDGKVNRRHPAGRRTGHAPGPAGLRPGRSPAREPLRIVVPAGCRRRDGAQRGGSARRRPGVQLQRRLQGQDHRGGGRRMPQPQGGVRRHARRHRDAVPAKCRCRRCWNWPPTAWWPTTRRRTTTCRASP